MSLREKIESLRCERSFTTKYKGPDRALERLAYEKALDDVLVVLDANKAEPPSARDALRKLCHATRMEWVLGYDDDPQSRKPATAEDIRTYALIEAIDALADRFPK